MIRIIPRLDIKAPNLIKGIHLEGVRQLGHPKTFATRYYSEGADELIYMDAVASLYGRNSILDLVKETSEEIFIPLTVGGGIRSINDAQQALRAGADKIAINTAAVARPSLMTEMAERFGSQCVVLSIEAQRTTTSNQWLAFTDNGRTPTGLDVVEWAKQGEKLGAGEILLTSIDQEGTRKGFDIALVKKVSEAVRIPVIASGGMGTIEHLEAVANEGHADAVAIADLFHYNRMTIPELKNSLQHRQIEIRAL